MSGRTRVAALLVGCAVLSGCATASGRPLAFDSNAPDGAGTSTAATPLAATGRAAPSTGGAVPSSAVPFGATAPPGFGPTPAGAPPNAAGAVPPTAAGGAGEGAGPAHPGPPTAPGTGPGSPLAGPGSPAAPFAPLGATGPAPAGGAGIGGGSGSGVGAPPGSAGPPPPPGGSQPDGPGGTWRLAFDDEFTQESALNQAQWSQTSPAEGECGQGNHGNNQAEWNQAYTNDTVDPADGLVLTDLRQTVNACGDTFSWTGGLVASKQSFPAGDVIEERFRIPADVPVGGWDAFWTWCANGGNGCEVDGYEDYPPNSYGNGSAPMSDHVGSGLLNSPELTSGGTQPVVSLGTWHTVDVVMGALSVSWYLDGRYLGSAVNAAPLAPYNLILDNDVCRSGGSNGCPTPAAGTNRITEDVAYVRVWSP